MSEKKIVVPEGMRHAVALALLHVFGETNYHPQIPVVLEAALRWLSENPIVPTTREAHSIIETAFSESPFIYDRPGDGMPGQTINFTSKSQLSQLSKEQEVFAEWQRRMFYAPEPEPEEVNDLLWSKGLYSGDKAFYEAIPAINESVVEAFRRGQKSEKR